MKHLAMNWECPLLFSCLKIKEFIENFPFHFPIQFQGRAKQLVNAGYKTLRHLAHADPAELVANIQHLPKKVAHQIVAAAKVISS